MTLLTRMGGFCLSRGTSFCLQDGGLISVERPCRNEQVRCARGTLWITQAGDPRDVLLKAGECWRMGDHGRVVIQALGEAQVIVEGVSG